MNIKEMSFQKSELWIRLAVCINVHIKRGMLRVLHNEIHNPNMTKIPSDPVQLFSYMVKNKNTLDEAKRKKILKNDQYFDLLPHDKNVDSSKLDITLIRFLIQTFSGITNDEGHWREPKNTDLSIAAFIYRAAGMRNTIFHYKNMETLDETEFESFWKDIEYILSGLQYKEDIEPIKTQSLDPTLVQTIHRDMTKEFLTHLQDYKTECAKEPRVDYISRRFRDVKRGTEETDLGKILDDNYGLIIHGEAGLGKSVTARHIKQEWSNGRILKDKHIIFYNSKKINQKIKVRSNAATLWFSDIVTVLKAKGKTIEDLAIFNCVKAAIENLLIIIDGIDEFPIKELANEQYISELEEKIQNNDEISAIDTIVGIYFGFLFPNAHVCLLGRTGEFERLKSLKDQPNSSIFDEMNRIDLQLLAFNPENVKDFTCLKICKQQSINGQISCEDSCQEIYEQIKDIELSKVPTDLNSLIELYKTHPNKNIGRITRTKIFIATILNRFNEHTKQKMFYVNKTFKNIQKDMPELVEGIRVLGEISFNTLLEENVTVEVEEENIKDIVYLKYKELTIEREILERFDFFYVRDLVYYHVLEPYHTSNIEFLSACYLYSNPDQWKLILNLNQDRMLVILSNLAGLYVDDYFTRDFVKNVLSTFDYSIDHFFKWLYNIKNVRKVLPDGGHGYNCWYGLVDEQRYSPLYLLDYIHREIEIPKLFIPKTIVCYCADFSSFEWYNMEYFKHDILTRKNTYNFNIKTFLDEFDDYTFIIKGNIYIDNNEEIKLINYFHNNYKIRFKINEIIISTTLTTNIDKQIKLNLLTFFRGADLRTVHMLLSAFSPPTTQNVKQIKTNRFIDNFDDHQTKQISEGLCGVDVIALESTCLTFKQLDILQTVENKNKQQINFRLVNLKFDYMFALPYLGARHIAFCYTVTPPNDTDLVNLKESITSNKQLHIDNFDKYKIIDTKSSTFIRKDNYSNDQSFYLQLNGVEFTNVSSNVFASTFSLIPTLECEDNVRYILSSQWHELSRSEDCHINELRIWLPTLDNLKYFIRIKTNKLQLICKSKDKLKELLVNIAFSEDVQLDKTIKVFVVKYDEDDWDFYEEIIVFSGKTIEEFKNNDTVYNSQLDNITETVPYYEGEHHLKWWCCEIRFVGEIKVNEINNSDKIRFAEEIMVNKSWSAKLFDKLKLAR